MRKSVQSQYTIRWHAARRAGPKFNPVSFWLQSLLLCCCYWSVGKPCPTLQPHELKHARLPYPSLFPGVCSNSWCHPTTSSSVTHFFSCPQSFPASGSFPMSPLFPTGGQSIGALEVREEYWKSHSGLIFFRTEPILLSFLKSLFELVAMLSLFHGVFVCLIVWFWPWGIWDLNSPTRDQTHTTCTRRLTNRLPGKSLFLIFFFYAWYLTMEK